jgi:hypothetical protein
MPRSFKERWLHNPVNMLAVELEFIRKSANTSLDKERGEMGLKCKVKSDLSP